MASNATLLTETKFYAAKKSDDEKSVWFFFLRDAPGNLAKCNKCDRKIKTVGGSTKGLHVHLQSMHSIDLLKRNATPASSGSDSTLPAVPGSSASNANDNQPTKKSRSMISTYFIPENDQSLPAILARLVAVDGLSFNVICTSEDIRAGLKARGHTTLPTSPNAVKVTVIGYAKKLREVVSNEIALAKADGQRFSLTFDEWSSLRNRRYMNINVHALNGKFWSLGLTRVEGSMCAKDCIKLAQTRLSLHGLSLQNDIVCIITDGASVMSKVGKLLAGTGPYQQLCFAHGLQLAVLDVLYRKPKHSSDTDIADSVELEPDVIDTEDSSDLFKMTYDMQKYDPNDVSVCCEDECLVVRAKDALCHRIQLPADLDPSQLSSTISGGFLVIQGVSSHKNTPAAATDHADSEDDDIDLVEGIHIEEEEPDEGQQPMAVTGSYCEVIQKV